MEGGDNSLMGEKELGKKKSFALKLPLPYSCFTQVDVANSSKKRTKQAGCSDSPGLFAVLLFWML